MFAKKRCRNGVRCGAWFMMGKIDAVDPCVVTQWEADSFTSVNISLRHERMGGPLGPCESQMWTLVR